MTTDRLTVQSRDADLRRMAQEGVDVLVVGGGVTGAGIALDAAGRGLSVGLLEAQDWGAGTSSRSSKLVHGGLRYLQMLDFKLVAEALTERGLLIDRLAPHLVRAVPFLYPLEKQWERPYVAAGVGLYDLLATVGTDNRAVPTHRHLGAKGMKEAFPGIRSDAAIGAIKYYDGQVDDARLVLGLVRTARQYGAAVANRAEVVELTTNPQGRVDGARARDAESGEEFHVAAGTVVSAAGVWTERTQDLAQASTGLHVLASKGIHIVVPRDAIDGQSGIILQTSSSVLFIIPWSRYWVIGTTDTAYHEDLVHPVATAKDIDYVLEQANRILARPLTRGDVVGTWAGLRPLLQPKAKGDGGSSKVSREHTVMESAPGLVSIAGGKLTTYRVMAKDAIDFVLGKEVAAQRPSLSHTTPLVGAVGFPAYATRADQVGAAYGWDRFRMAHLLHRYGSSLPELLALVDERPDLARPLEGADAYIRAEIVYGMTHEGAAHLEDLMVTRTRLTYEVRGHGLSAIDEIADLAAETLGWDDARRAAEVEAYRARCAAEDEASQLTDDEDAAAVRGRRGDVAQVLATNAEAPDESATETDPSTPGEAVR
ncbi:glycerol-3-phosphate dehydrogenase/oxidase [Agilicoccus flavus]|uniref:glycerol-3-phosphate dehydrogenase/oxidase n=1 Tax=Agilicoccus flavus TaxID=2775968 RepID=UPI001CF6AEBD|nr:glycerol-3-phosphate dehydrogenase/oxidase [Agilicoccus flavus]